MLKNTARVKNTFHPGVFLQELLEDNKLTAYRLAKDTFLPQTRISEILREKRSITPDTAKRLAKYFGTSAQYWMNLQTSFDLANCRVEKLADISTIGG